MRKIICDKCGKQISSICDGWSRDDSLVIVIIEYPGVADSTQTRREYHQRCFDELALER